MKIFYKNNVSHSLFDTESKEMPKQVRHDEKGE